MKHLRSFLIVSLALFTCGKADAAAAGKPNIIFILADDIGLPGFGCTGGIYKTPNIDALAAGGTRFEYCFAAPLCAPSRAMLMTGRYAFRTGVTDNGRGAAATPQKDGCVAQLLKQAGYATAVAGKWRQLSYFTTKEEGAKWGFDEFLIWGAGASEEGEGKVGRKVRAADGTKSKPDRYWNPDYNFNAGSVSPFFPCLSNAQAHSPVPPAQEASGDAFGALHGPQSARRLSSATRCARNSGCGVPSTSSVAAARSSASRIRKSSVLRERPKSSPRRWSVT